MTAPDPFFGGQKIVDVFGASARSTRRLLLPYDTIIGSPLGAELVNVETPEIAGPGLGGRAAPDRTRTHPSGGDLRWQ